MIKAVDSQQWSSSLVLLAVGTVLAGTNLCGTAPSLDKPLDAGFSTMAVIATSPVDC
jgi:hypothetical protein